VQAGPADRWHVPFSGDKKSRARRDISCRAAYEGISEPHYLFHDKTVVVTNCGRLCLYRNRINLSTCLAGRPSEVLPMS
jgi:hypothetical protein